MVYLLVYYYYVEEIIVKVVRSQDAALDSHNANVTTKETLERQKATGKTIDPSAVII